MSNFKLFEEIIARSVANTWIEAKAEWELAEVFYQEEPDVCLCGHSPINEICVIRHKRSGSTEIVGNVCVRKFLVFPSEPLFRGFRRIFEDPHGVANLSLIDYAKERGWITDWEYSFMVNTLRRRKPTFKQREKRKEINLQIIDRIYRPMRREPI